MRTPRRTPWIPNRLPYLAQEVTNRPPGASYSSGPAPLDPATVLSPLFQGDNAVNDGSGGDGGAGSALAVNSWPAAVGGVTATNSVAPDIYSQPTQKAGYNNGHKGVYYDRGETTTNWHGGIDSKDRLTFTPAVTDATTLVVVYTDETGHSTPEFSTSNSTVGGNNTNFALNGGAGVRLLDKISHVNADILTNGQTFFDGEVIAPKHAFRPRTIRLLVLQFANPTKFENVGWGTNGFDTELRGTILEWGLKSGAFLTSDQLGGLLAFYKAKYTWGAKLPLIYAHGDSITDGPGGNGMYGWMSYAHDDLGPIVDTINGGLFGEVGNPNGIARLSSEALYLAALDRPLKVLTVMYGINDLNAGHTAASVLQAYNDCAVAWKAVDPARNKVIGLTTSRNGAAGRGGGDATTYDASWTTVYTSLLASPATYHLDAAADCSQIPELVDVDDATNYIDQIHLRGPGQHLLYTGGTGSGMGIRPRLRTLLGV